MLVALVKQSSGPVSPQDLRALLHKDAVYNAVGLAAFDLYDDIDFDQWLVHGIEQEMAIKDSNYRIVRRRAAWLIGQWSGVKLSPELRPRLYEILVPLLNTGEDLVVSRAEFMCIPIPNPLLAFFQVYFCNYTIYFAILGKASSSKSIKSCD